LDWLGDEPVWVELTPEGTVVPVPEPDPEDWAEAAEAAAQRAEAEAEWAAEAGFDPETGQWEVPDPESDWGSNPLLMEGLTADEAFQQHHAARRINPNQGELPGTGGPAEEIRRQIEEARKKIPARTPAEDAAYEKALRERGQRSPGPVVPPPVPPPVSPMEDRNPELRSMDSQMLTDMMAAQVTQPEQGWLGGALGGVGGFWEDTLSQMQGNTTLPYAQQAQGQLDAFQNMPTEQKSEIVLLGLAAAAAASGVGGPLVPPLLGGSALLTATG
jgi:hypothetical protein